jgi:integrase/recombinase XerD
MREADQIALLNAHDAGLLPWLASRYSTATARSYAREIALWLRSNPHAPHAQYGDVAQYIATLRELGYQPTNLNRILAALKAYYRHRVLAGHQHGHPCSALRLRDARRNRDPQLQDLLTPEELNTLVNTAGRDERYPLLSLRNRVVMGLLGCQGLTTGELVRLTLGDLDLNAATVYIRESRRLNPRTLPLEPRQIIPLHQYITETRPLLLARAADENTQSSTETLILTHRGTPERGEGISYLVSTCRPLLPHRPPALNNKLSPETLRQSAIAHRLASGHGIRQVQHWAGHRNPSTTERYRATITEALRHAVLRYHPLDAGE